MIITNWGGGLPNIIRIKATTRNSIISEKLTVPYNH